MPYEDKVKDWGDSSTSQILPTKHQKLGKRHEIHIEQIPPSLPQPQKKAIQQHLDLRLLDARTMRRSISVV